jgi:hypothetical protein
MAGGCAPRSTRGRRASWPVPRSALAPRCLGERVIRARPRAPATNGSNLRASVLGRRQDSSCEAARVAKQPPRASWSGPIDDGKRMARSNAKRNPGATPSIPTTRAPGAQRLEFSERARRAASGRRRRAGLQAVLGGPQPIRRHARSTMKREEVSRTQGLHVLPSRLSGGRALSQLLLPSMFVGRVPPAFGPKTQVLAVFWRVPELGGVRVRRHWSWQALRRVVGSIRIVPD